MVKMEERGSRLLNMSQTMGFVERCHSTILLRHLRSTVNLNLSSSSVLEGFCTHCTGKIHLGWPVKGSKIPCSIRDFISFSAVFTQCNGVFGVLQLVILVKDSFTCTSMSGNVKSLVRSLGSLSTKTSLNSANSSLYGSGRSCGRGSTYATSAASTFSSFSSSS